MNGEGPLPQRRFDAPATARDRRGASSASPGVFPVSGTTTDPSPCRRLRVRHRAPLHGRPEEGPAYVARRNRELAECVGGTQVYVSDHDELAFLFLARQEGVAAP